ncbi:MAG: DUF294 nucleotidyltransferase-like domain-containing protein [Geminicoccaceae bacterium]
MTTQTTLFRLQVRDRMESEALVVPADAAVSDVVAKMATGGQSAALVRAADGGLAGILTERDVVARVACRDVAGLPVERVMTTPVLAVSAEERLYAAIGTMRRHGLRHLAVSAADGTPSGVLDLHAALGVAVGALARHIDRLTHEDTLEGLAEVKAAQVDLVETLLADHVPAPEIQALVSDINNDLYRRVLRLLVAEAGPPPVPFAAIVMGSGGRGESLLFPDQDNGLILADYPDAEHDRIDGWFRELAERLTAAMAAVGFALCRGGVMATNPLWRKTLPQWQAQVELWVRRRHEAMMLAADILFDFVPVYGETALAAALRRTVTERAAGSPHFLHAMHSLAAGHGAGIGWFGRFLTERHDPAHRGEIELKRSGTLPLSEAVRLLALRGEVPATGTLDRIEGLRARGLLAGDEAEACASAFGTLTRLQLRQQVQDYRGGRVPGNFVDPASLPERERGELRQSLKAVNALRDRVRMELTSAVL